jgi:hypothetical protein
MTKVKESNVRNLILVNMRGTGRQNEFAQYLLVKFDSVSEWCNAEEEFAAFEERHPKIDERVSAEVKMLREQELMATEEQKS